MGLSSLAKKIKPRGKGNVDTSGQRGLEIDQQAP